MGGARERRRRLVRRRLGRWLREQRQRAGLSQRELGALSSRYPWGFDPSWVSHWEREGPREGFLKGLAYLDLLDVDADVVYDIVRLPLEFAEEPVEIDWSRSLAYFRRFVETGRLEEGLGIALAALDREEGGGDPLQEASLLLIVGALAKRVELYSLAIWAAEATLERTRSIPGAAVLAARAAILGANVHTWRGHTFDAQCLLDTIGDDLRRADPYLDAAALHARAFTELESGRFAEASLHYLEAIELYPQPHRKKVEPSLRACFALAKARKGSTREALDAVERVLAAPAAAGDRFLDAVVRQTAGHALLVCGSASRAIDLLRAAESTWSELKLELRLLETRLLLLAAARAAGVRPLADLVARAIRAPLARRRIPERIRRLRLRVEAGAANS